MKVIKRNGEEVAFESEKIYQAITKAMGETEIGYEEHIVNEVVEYISDISRQHPVPLHIEEIQDMIETTLMDKGRFDVAKRYILYRDERNRERDKIWDMTDLQKDIYEKKYRFQGESFSQFLDRVSGGNSYVRKLMQKKRFLPAGRILANRGLNERGKKVCYSNCFVNTPPEDNLESIFQVASDMARTYSYGGGVGISLKHLRPKGAVVNNSADETTGAVSFMDLYSTTTGLIGMRGRRGALMITLPVDHPDIEDFVDVKNDLSKVNFANISIMISDEFMEAVENDANWTMKFEVEDTGEVITKTIKARKLFRKIAESNHKMAEPGILFWDRVQSYHIKSEDENFEFSATNPCGELPLDEGGSCLLSSINLSEYVLNPFTDDAMFDYEQFTTDIPHIVEFMDDLLEEGINHLPLEQQKKSARNYRQIGIGVMGLADMFIKMGITYADLESNGLMSTIMEVMSNTILQSNALLAKERGVYPEYSSDVLNTTYLESVANDITMEMIGKYGLRNSQLLSIAPTGSISTMLGVSGGVEPIFAISHNRKSESLGDGEDVVYKVYAQIVQDYMNASGITKEDELPEYFVTSHDISYEDRIEFQGTIQTYVDNAISSTVNLPNSATVEDIEKVYQLAWMYGLKGVTIYRDGCMREGILTTNDAEPDKPKDMYEDDYTDEEREILDGLLNDMGKCPECGGEMVYTNNCTLCLDCGHSPCS